MAVTEIVMPQLSDSMEQGTILAWLKAAGEMVAPADELVEIETDKATVTHSAPDTGLLEIIAPEGSTVAVGQPIARLRQATTDHRPPAAKPPLAAAQVSVRPSVDSLGTIDERAPATAANPSTTGRRDRRVRAPITPLARRTADVHGVALDEIRGTGPLGRITQADVLNHAGLQVDPAAPRPRAAPLGPIDPARRSFTQRSGRSGIDGQQAGPSSARHEPSRLQQLIARRMSESTATIPHFQVQTEVVMDAAIALRAELKALAGDRDTTPSINDLIIRAAALALRDHPLANGSFRDGGIELHDAINIGMAVATDDGLVVAAIADTVNKSLGQIARETRTLAARVRSGQVTPAELDGVTFTVSNLGMFGMTAITPIINPPQAAILGVGAIRDTLARVDGEIVERSQLTLTLSCDHRILYGADGARCLKRIRELLETPLYLAL